MIAEVIDETLDLSSMNEEELDAYQIQLLRRMNIARIKRHGEAVQDTKRIAELNLRMLYICAAGKVPANLHQLVQEIVSPTDPPIKSSFKSEDSGNGS